MPVHQPHPAELIPIPPPFSVSLEFGDIELLIGASLSWNAFLVTTHRERECIYKSADLTAAVVESLEEALLQDFRKIGVRRCVWQKEIECALLECKKDPKSAQSSSGQQNVHRDPYAPAADHSILAAADESNPYQTLRKNSDVERASSDSSRNPSPDVSDDDDDLTAISKKSSRHKKKKAPLLITNDKHNESPINPLENIRVNKPYQPLDQPPSSAPTVPYRHESPSSFPLTSAYRGSSAFVGIENQANTCYLNAALQSLYHIPYFRSCMYKVNLEALRRKDVVEALQSLFAALQLKHEGTTTVPLTSAFRWSAEDLRHQHDAHEMILILFDCIEKQICSTQSRTTSPHITEPPTDEVAADEDAFVVEDHDTEPIAPPPPLADAAATKPESTSPPPQRNFIQKLFHGEQMYYTSVPEAQYESKQSEPFLVVELPVQHLDSLEASLDEISKPTIIEGFNVDHPDGTKSAHNAERTLRFSQLPPVLLIHPNRVVFDFEKLAQVTVNNRWSFPVHLDLAQHTRHTKRSVSPSQDHVSHADGLTPPRARDADIGQVDSSPAPVQFDSPDTKEPGGGDTKEQMEREGSLFQQSEVFSMTDYELRTVVLHSGTAASGHYIACVHHGNGEWTCFNDDRVHSIMESEVMRRAFGGIPHSSFDRVERAKLLVYVRKPSAPRLLAEVPIPEAIQASASIHEKKLVLDCRLMCEAFADGLGGKMIERIASTVFRIEFRAAATLDEVYVILGKKLTVDPHRLVMWKYGYHYVEQSSDRAVRVTKMSELVVDSRFIVVEIISEAEAARHNDDKIATLPMRDSIAHMYPLRVWNPKECSLQFMGTARSIENAITIASTAFGDGDNSTKLRTSSGDAASPVEEDDGNEAGKAPAAANNHHSAAEEEKISWTLYSYYGSHPLLRLLTSTAVLINGVCLIAAPSTVTPAEIIEVLNARPVSVMFSFIRPSDCDEASELWELTVDENMTYTELQKLVFQHLREPSEGMPGLSAEFLESYHLIGFHRHHIDTCGPSRILETPFQKNSMARTENRVRNLLKTHGSGHNTSTDSASIVRRVYIAILPPEMPESSQWPQMQYFVVATGLERKCIAYAHLHQHNTVGEYLATLHRQASKRLVELESIPLSQMRILGLDWRGKIYKQFTQHNQQLRGDGVYSYSVDVIAMPPIRHQVASPARVEHDNEDDDDTIEIESAEGDDELDHSKNRSSGGSSSSRSSNNDNVDERHTNAPSPVWENFDVYHITQYGDGEDYIAPPTNICLDISRLERITGELIMDEVLYASRLSPSSLRYNTMRLVAQVILRGSFMTDSVRLACDQCITPEVLREVGSKVRCILIDHTECMFASSMMSGGSGSPSPGRTPVKTVKQRAPEAVIRIAD